MANKFQNIEQFAKNFSNRYKVDFSFEKYHSQKLDKKLWRQFQAVIRKCLRKTLCIDAHL